MDGCEGVKLRGGFGYDEPISQNPSGVGVCNSRSRGPTHLSSIADEGGPGNRSLDHIQKFTVINTQRGAGAHLWRGPLPSAVD